MISTDATRALAQKTLDFIHANPERHDQSLFINNPDAETGCGTSMCVAGTADWLVNGLDAMRPNIESRAAGHLGLSRDEAYALFFEMDEERALQKLKKIVVGEPFSKEDFHTASDLGEDPVLDEFYWKRHCNENGIVDE